MANSTANTQGQPTVTGQGEGGATASNPDYIAFVLVPVFFLLGLLGVVICHVLKRKGYRCTTEAQDGEGDECEEEEKDPELGGDMNDTFSDNNDTVGQIVHYIMRNEANSDALKAMLHRENSIDSDGPPLTPNSPGSPTPPMTPISPGAPPGAAKHTCSHLHTIGGLGGQKNICTRCTQKKWPLMRRPSARKTENRRSQHGEVTVLAVGRFRVTKCEKPTRERRTMLISDSNGSVPTSPTEVEPKSRTTSTDVEPKSRTTSTDVEPKSRTTSTDVEPKSRTTSTDVEPKSRTTPTDVEPKSHTTSTDVEPKSHTTSTEVEPKSRVTSESQQEQTDNLDKEKR